VHRPRQLGGLTAPFDELLQAAKGGDERAFASLYRAYQPGLLRYLRVSAGAAAEDIAGEVWYDIARGLGSFVGGEDGFRGWLFTTARRRFLDSKRAAARRPVVTGAEVVEAGSAALDPAELVAADLSTEGALALIASTLPPDQAEIVVLRAVAGLDVEQVARIVGKRPGAVRVAAHRGLRKLAERLAEKSGLEV
jgi:RNA polymerase sigma-70 factor (ECF subfamily)